MTSIDAIIRTLYLKSKFQEDINFDILMLKQLQYSKVHKKKISEVCIY